MSFDMLRRVVSQNLADVSEVHIASIITVIALKRWLTSARIDCNIPDDSHLHPRRHEVMMSNIMSCFINYTLHQDC
jgi:hypothetical protein